MITPNIRYYAKMEGLHGIRENTQIRNNNRGGVLPTDGKNNRQGRQGINVFTGEQG